MGKIFYLLGKSASGKDSIYRRLMEREDLHLRPVVLYTTRPRRKGETDGTEYHFIDDAAFERLREAGKLIEYREYHTVQGIWRYMTVEDGQISLEKQNFLMIGTLESYRNMVKYFGEDRLIPVYIEVEDGVRLERALQRERMQPVPGYAELCRRFLADEADFSRENLERCGITRGFQNENLEECILQIAEMIRENSEN